MSILDIIIFLFFTGGSCCLRLLFLQQETFVGGIYFGRTFLPGWVVGMSIFATYVSSISYLAYPGKAICPIGMLLYSACPFR